ncbi:hypothetical protein CSUI_005395 [Cystoisospora suis]|uniref:Transmembrane protein n=1 Tax=Cystoisospora suis TaxID=483139 RepID=A0A2C6KY48_9APIC|nr:hypothetical protein CSUI_005395 [Cystoisospora suis]
MTLFFLSFFLYLYNDLLRRKLIFFLSVCLSFFFFFFSTTAIRVKRNNWFDFIRLPAM